MSIERLGLFFSPPGSGWALMHALDPFPQALGGNRYRIHFACRDSEKRSRGGAIDVAMDPHPRCLGPLIGPTIDLGTLGAFDDSGAVPSSIVEVGDLLYMYYIGWSRAVTVPFSFHIGLAVSCDGGKTFERHSRAPVLGRNEHDPFMTGAPWVILEGGVFRMWYVSCTEWFLCSGEEGQPMHRYTVKHAESQDGIEWQTNDHLCLPYLGDEYAIARPVVTVGDDGYQMLYSYRGFEHPYRVGRAISEDGIHWTRQPGPFLDVSNSGWDSEMVCYACPLTHAGTTFLMYNGNGYGADGFGFAVVR